MSKYKSGKSKLNLTAFSDMKKLLELYPGHYASLEEMKGNVSTENYVYWMNNDFQMSEFPLMAEHTQHCDYQKIIGQAAEGTGLAFVVFTEAIIQFPFPQVWSILFFLMLLMLGLGSMFGTLEGVITSLNDAHMINIKKPIMTGILCLSACIVGLVFTTRAGKKSFFVFKLFLNLKKT